MSAMSTFSSPIDLSNHLWQSLRPSPYPYARPPGYTVQDLRSPIPVYEYQSLAVPTQLPLVSAIQRESYLFSPRIQMNLL